MATNFVLLTVDSLRADYANPSSGLMPVLNENAESGVQFSRAYANGFSTPVSFPTLLTGTYASHYGGHGYMSEERPFLASLLQDEGYQTAAFHTNPLLRKEKNYDTGFDVYNDFHMETGLLSRLRYLVTQNLDSDSLPYKLLKRVYHSFRTVSDTKDYAPAPELNQRALDWYDERDEEKPFFLWVHYMDVHYPFYPPDEVLAEVTERSISKSRAITVNGKMHESGTKLTEEDVADLESLYRGEVRYMDNHLGNLLDALRARGHDSDTLYIITSDHGELFGEHGLFGHPPSGYEKNFHVPLVIFGPGVPEGKCVDEMASLLDLPPTIADILELDSNAQWEGESLCPYLAGADRESKSMFMGDTNVLAYQNEGWRLVWWRTKDNPESAEREWELRRLPSCDCVPLSEHPDMVERFREKMHAYLDRAEESDELAEPEVDEATEDRLEALGYK